MTLSDKKSPVETEKEEKIANKCEFDEKKF